MMLSSLTMIGFELNAVLSGCPDFELSLDQVHEATQERKLIELLNRRCAGLVDFSLLLAHKDELSQVEDALFDAASALKGREQRKVGIMNSGLFLVVAIIFEAIQQKFCPLVSKL